MRKRATGLSRCPAAQRASCPLRVCTCAPRREPPCVATVARQQGWHLHACAQITPATPSPAQSLEGDDCFVHYTSIMAVAFRTLTDGEPVEYQSETDPRSGRLRAVHVTGPDGRPFAPRAPVARDRVASRPGQMGAYGSYGGYGGSPVRGSDPGLGPGSLR